MKTLIAYARLTRLLPALISLCYLLVSFLWIYLSDYYLADVVRDIRLLSELQTIKGWFFVVSSTIMLFLLLHYSFRKVRMAGEHVFRSEYQYRTLMSQASDGILLADKEWNITEANTRACELLGYEMDELTAMNALDLVDKEDIQKVPYDSQELLDGKTLMMERRLRKKDGSIIHVEISAKLLITGQMQAILRDITQRIQMQQQLQTSEREYKILFSDNPQPMWVYDPQTLAFLAVNNTAVASYGYSGEEFLSMTIRDIRPGEEHSSLEENIRTQDSYFQQSGPWRHRRKDGTLFFVEIISTSIEFRGSQARLVLAKDITEQKAAAEALAKSEARYRNLFQMTPVSIWEVDYSVIKNHIDLLRRAGVTNFREYLEKYPEETVESIKKVKVIDVNEATMELLEADSKEQAIRGFTDILHPSIITSQRESIIAIAEGKNRFEMESDGVTNKGKPIHIFMLWTVASGYENSYERVLVTLVDITGKVNAERQLMKLNAELEQRVRERTRQLEEAIRELESFSYSVSHDLRAPLRAISGFADILMQEHAEKIKGEPEELLRTIIRNSEQMHRLIEDLLNFSKLLNKGLHMKTVNMNELAHSVLEEQLASMGDRIIETTVEGLPDCIGDTAMLRQVWINLISNALKFTRRTPGALVRISGRMDGGHSVYTVEDNGAGFNMNYASKLFDVFKRLHSESEFEGTGVGLALVKRIITRHNGTITANAEVNKGAVFTFTLPAPVQQTQQA